MNVRIQAITLLERVALVSVKGETEPILLRFEKLKAKEDGTAFFNCSVRHKVDEIGTEAPTLKRKIYVSEILAIQFLDTERQQRLRMLNTFAVMVNLDGFTEDRKAAFLENFSHMYEERDELLKDNVTEFKL
ncbi:hypothetical protein [Paenibacillus solani]|uniref:hypothetical protein n=1 Tax=Paenibacillus solani TaxID=1705565 RepID=UPI003D2B1F9F